MTAHSGPTRRCNEATPACPGMDWNLRRKHHAACCRSLNSCQDKRGVRGVTRHREAMLRIDERVVKTELCCATTGGSPYSRSETALERWSGCGSTDQPGFWLTPAPAVPTSGRNPATLGRGRGSQALAAHALNAWDDCLSGRWRLRRALQQAGYRPRRPFRLLRARPASCRR